MVGTRGVKGGKKDGKLNLLVCYIFNDTVYVDSLNPEPANASPPKRGLTSSPLWRAPRDKGIHKGQRRGEGERTERTISQIICKD